MWKDSFLIVTIPLFLLLLPPTDIFSADVCGPDKELDVETCQCVCPRRDQFQDCGPNRHFDVNTCQCVCNVVPAPSCPPNHVFNKETCQCTCTKTCPRHQPLNKTKCSCECNESPNKCFLKGRRFHQATCRWGQIKAFLSNPPIEYLSFFKMPLFAGANKVFKDLETSPEDL